MNKEELIALRGSISHWDRNATGKSIDTRADSCDLCVFHDMDCEVCIIGKTTCKELCRGTPYEEANHCYHVGDWEGFRHFAYKEYLFLCSLLPSTEEQIRILNDE